MSWQKSWIDAAMIILNVEQEDLRLNENYAHYLIDSGSLKMDYEKHGDIGAAIDVCIAATSGAPGRKQLTSLIDSYSATGDYKLPNGAILFIEDVTEELGYESIFLV